MPFSSTQFSDGTGVEGFIGEPNGEVTSPSKAGLVLTPVLHPVSRLRRICAGNAGFAQAVTSGKGGVSFILHIARVYPHQKTVGGHSGQESLDALVRQHLEDLTLNRLPVVMEWASFQFGA